MKKLTFLLISLFAYLTVFAGEVTEQQALQIAQKFMQGKQFKQQNLRRASVATDNAFYVFNVENNDGFVIVAGDDQMPEILGYSEKGHFDLSNAPDNVKWLMGYYAKIAQSLKDGNSSTSSRRVPANRAEVQPLIKTTWDQGAPYNLHCPEINGSLAPTGCVATAMAQVVNYHQWPLKEVQSLGAYNTFNAKIDIPILPTKIFNWYNMSEDEIAWLMRYCGQSVMMDYKSDESSASPSNIPYALISYFGYSKNTKFVSRESFSDEEWEDLIYNEVNLGRPVIYNGILENGISGHSFVIHGYREGMFMVNWGWSGDCDGYFMLTNLAPNEFMSFNNNQNAVIGIQPATDGDYIEEGSVIIEVEEAGTLSNYISDDNKYKITKLTLKGKLNGTDIRLIREMAGTDYDGQNTPGQLHIIDLSEVQIVEGGEPYAWGTTTENDIIGIGMFSYLTPLTSITFPSSVKYINSMALGVNWNLSSIAIDENNQFYESKGNGIYERESGKLIMGCASTVIPEGVTSIGSYAFYAQNELTSIKFPESLTTIESNAFYACERLFSLYIPKNLIKIKDNAFTNTGVLSKIIVDSNNTVYDSRNNCNAIIETASNTLILGCTATEIPEGVTDISNNAFAQSDISSIKFPQSLVHIGQQAFAGCGLRSIEIPSSVTSIDYGAFESSVLATVKVYNQNPIEISEGVFSGLLGNSTLIVPDGTKEKYENAIGWKVFPYIMEASSYSAIGQRTIHVSPAGSLPDLISADEKPLIEKLTLTGELNGTDFQFIREMANSEFFVYGSLKHLDISDARIVEGGNPYIYQADFISESLCFGGSTSAGRSLEQIILPKTLKGVAKWAFQGSGLNSIIIPKSVTSIGEDIFYNCGRLSSISVEEGNPVYDSRGNCNAIIETATNKLTIGCKNTIIPNNVKIIEASAFNQAGLASVEIPDGVTEIGKKAFENNNSLTTIYIPNSVVSIGSSPLASCQSITSISVSPDNSVYDSRNNCNAIIETATGTLIQGCANTVIPNDITKISYGAFQNQVHLASIEIPASVTEIAGDAFDGCIKLTTVVSHIKKPFIITPWFSNIPSSTLYVPYGTKEAYASTYGWKEFSNIIEMEPDDSYQNNSASVENAKIGKHYAALNGEVNVPISITGEGLSPVTSIDYTINNSAEQHLEVEPISYMMTSEVLIPFAADATTGEVAKTLKITKVNGVTNECTENIIATGTLVTVAKKPKIVPIVEEFTGTWCGWCSRGLVGLKMLNKQFGRDVITIAIHDGGDNEPMMLPEYRSVSGTYPSCQINRGDMMDPYFGTGQSAFGIKREVEAAQRDYALGSIEMTANWTDNTRSAIGVKTTTTFVEDVAESPYQIGYILLEDGVTGTGDAWLQSNYYAGSNTTDENLKELTGKPAKITDMKYDNVPVAVWEPMTGVAGTIPTMITHDVPMEYTFKADISGNTRIQNKNKLTVVVLLLDKTTGKIINAAKQSMAVQGDVTGSGTVDVQDATLVVNYILGNGSDEYDYTVADMNGDNEVDVFDVTAMINVILSSNNNAPTLRRSMEPNESVRLSADGDEVLVAVDNASRFTSFQFDVKVPKGAELLGVDWNGKMDSHLLQFAKTGEDTYKVVALSMESAPLSDLNDTLLKLHLSNKTVGEMTIDNILFVTPMGEAVRFGSHPLDMTTGIQSVTHSQAGQIYDLSGQRLNMKREQLPKGVYIINNQKVVIK